MPLQLFCMSDYIDSAVSVNQLRDAVCNEFHDCSAGNAPRRSRREPVAKMESSPYDRTDSEFEELVRCAGKRMTRARRAVMECLRQARIPLTHSQIVRALRPQGFDPTTIYRNLVALTGLKILTRHELGDHLWRYELNRAERSPSAIAVHFSCTACNALIPLPANTVQGLLASNPTGGATFDEVLIRGVCAACRPRFDSGGAAPV